MGEIAVDQKGVAKMLDGLNVHIEAWSGVVWGVLGCFGMFQWTPQLISNKRVFRKLGVRVIEFYCICFCLGPSMASMGPSFSI